MNAEFASLLKLGRAERLQLVEDLWDSLAAEEAPPVTAAQSDELRRRRARFLQQPDSGLNWEQVQRQARTQ